MGYFKGLNDWKIVQILQTQEDGQEEQETQSYILQKHAQGVSDQIVSGDYTSLHCDDEEDNDGYCVFQWTFEPYTQQDGKEELMCSLVYLEREPQVKDGYYRTNETVKVRLQNVLKTGIKLDQVTDSKLLPEVFQCYVNHFCRICDTYKFLRVFCGVRVRFLQRSNLYGQVVPEINCEPVLEKLE